MEAMCMCLLILAYLPLVFAQAEGSRVGMKRRGCFEGRGGCSAQNKAGHRASRAETVGGFTQDCSYVKYQSAECEVIRADFGFLCGVKG